MTVFRRRLHLWFAMGWLLAVIFGQTLLLPQAAGAVGEVGRPELPHGIVRLPFDGEYEITQVPGCGYHDRKAWDTREFQELNDRAFDFGLYLDEVLAAGDGVVIKTYTDPEGALILVLDHGEGVRTYYVHLSEFRAAVGEAVTAGQVIGISGNSGFGGAYHLHFSATINNNDDPDAIGDAANINSLPGIPWLNEQLNEDGYAICNDQVRDFAFGAPVEAVESPDESDDMITADYVYDRDAALNAAFEHLHQPNEYDWDAAMYVSKVLWGGGLEWTEEWANEAVYDPDVLVNYLLSNYLATKTTVEWSDNTVGGALLADVIAYDWEGDGIIDHVAVVTGRDEQEYPLVSEHSPTTENRFWSWSDTDGMFFEEAYPESVAYLISISPITVPEF